MSTTYAKASGFFCFWTSASWSNPANLKAGFESIGLSGYEPMPMKPSPALREALCDHFRGKNVMVRPLKEDGGFILIDETRGESNNDYKKLFSVKLANEEGTRLAFDPAPPDEYQDIVNLYAKRLNSVPGHAVGSALVKIVASMRGTAIRKTGGMYWVNGKHADKWAGVQRVVEGAASEGDSRVYKVAFSLDADSIRAVKDAIQREILQESQSILDEMLKGDIGKRAMTARLEYLDELQAKVAEYESVVGESLKHLADALNNTKTASGLGAFQDMMRDQVGVQP